MEIGGRELFRFGASDSVGFGDWTNFVSSVNRAFEFLKSSPREPTFVFKGKLLLFVIFTHPLKSPDQLN